MPGETFPQLAISPGYARVTCKRPSLWMTGLIGPDSPRIINADNGWEIVPRPKQTGMTVWNGVEPIQGDFSILLDGFRTGPDAYMRRDDRIIDPQTDILAQLWAVARGSSTSQPGIIAIEGIPEFPNIDWVIETVELGDTIRSATNFKVGRVMVHLVVREYSPPRYVSAKAPTGTSKIDPVMWKVKKGDTPISIARKIGVKWTDIRDLNRTTVKKSNQKLKLGTRIRVPGTKDANRIIKIRAKH